MGAFLIFPPAHSEKCQSVTYFPICCLVTRALFLKPISRTRPSSEREGSICCRFQCHRTQGSMGGAERPAGPAQNHEDRPVTSPESPARGCLDGSPGWR